MTLEGYDSVTGKVTNPQGELMLRDQEGNLAAGWKLEKVIQHWKNKHSNTCYLSYHAIREEPLRYQFGPKVTLGKGTNLNKLIRGLYSSTINYAPGVNMKLEHGRWRPKKRNQFRVAWRDIHTLYEQVVDIDLSE